MVSSLLTATTRRPQAPSSAPSLLRRRTSAGPGLSLFGLSASSYSTSSFYPPKKLSQQTLSRILLYILLSIFLFYAIIVMYVARSSTSTNAVVSRTTTMTTTMTTTDWRMASGNAALSFKPPLASTTTSALRRQGVVVVAAKQELVARHDESDEHSIHHPGRIIIPAAEHHGRAHQESLESEQQQRSNDAEKKHPDKQDYGLEHIHQEEHHDPHIIIPLESEQQDNQQKQLPSDSVSSSSVAAASGPYVLKAFIEKVNYDEWNTKPLPVRSTATASQLQEITYPRVNSCSRLPELFPTDDTPVDADPFLPWIHDVFPTHDGKYIQIVAQNKRRCRSGTTPDEVESLRHFQPQVSLFQHVPVKRMINDTTTTSTTITTDNNNNNNNNNIGVRYRLASHDEADEDGMETRFICRFKPSMQETLSRHNFHYEYATFRKAGSKAMGSFSEEGHKDRKALHTSQLIFTCPVPTNLISVIQSGATVQDHDWATHFLDIIPIRTPPRFGQANAFFPPRYQMHQTSNTSALFDAEREWGRHHVLPKIEDSGRWENIPICQPSHMTYAKAFATTTTTTSSDKTAMRIAKSANAEDTPTVPHHRLIACTWSSSGYTTRGDRFAVTDGQRRMKEWLAYNLIIGFDHIYVYDNSPPNATLQEVTDLYPPHQVTRIPWPATVCNNRRNFEDSPGERSSQYAAESSCRLRFGPHADWIGGFDMDEYANPLGNFTSLYPILDRLDEEGTKILSLKSWRAWPRRDFIEEPIPIRNETICDEPYPCFDLKVPPNRTVLQTYNCDRQKGNKKEAMPAEKQLFRSDYVLQHFIHFSTVTVLTQMTQEETIKAGFKWKQRIHADLRHRFSDELTEASMLHAKAMATQDTAGWLRRCTGKQKHGTCRIGVPWPPGAENAGETKDAKGWLYNCYVNDKIENFWVPRLEESMRQLAAIAK